MEAIDSSAAHSAMWLIRPLVVRQLASGERLNTNVAVRVGIRVMYRRLVLHFRERSWYRASRQRVVEERGGTYSCPSLRAGARLDRGPSSVVEESPRSGGRVPHQVRLRRPRRGRGLRRRPRRRGSPGPPARRCRTLPVVTLIPVPVVVGAPGRIPLLTRAPVVAGRGSRGRLGDAAGQPQRGQCQAATHQLPNPRSPVLFRRHPPRMVGPRRHR